MVWRNGVKQWRNWFVYLMRLDAARSNERLVSTSASERVLQQQVQQPRCLQSELELLVH